MLVAAPPGDVSPGKELGHFEIALKGPSL